MKRAALIIVMLFLGCTQRSRPGAASKDTILAMEALSQKQDNSDTLGVLVKKISFKVIAAKEDTSIFKSGIMPWIDIGDPGKEIDRLIDADEIILHYSECFLIVDYPLKKPAKFTIKLGEKGMSRREFVWLVNEKYQEIYAEEEKTAHTKTIPSKERKQLLNRNETDGKYGIWGHDISDLAVNTLYVYRRADGEIFLTLDLDS